MASRGKKAKPIEAADSEGGRLTRHVGLRFTPESYEHLEKVGEALGLDVTNFIRSIIAENLATYEHRAQEAKRPKSCQQP